MRPAEAHLTPQEFELLLFAASDSNADASSAGASEAQQHLSGCAACQSVAERYRKNEEKLWKLKSWLQASRGRTSSSAGGSSAVRRPECPEEPIWFSLAAGLLSDGECALYVSHAARCDWCGPFLKEAMQDLAQDATLEEQEALAKLPTASAEWQHEMARKLAAQDFSTAPADAVAATGAVRAMHIPAVDVTEDEGSSSTAKKRLQEKQKKTGFSWWPKLAFAGAGLAVLAVAAWFAWPKNRKPDDVNQLLAQAYTKQRPFELRMPGADYGQSKNERGGGQGKRDLPPEFHLAESIIETELVKHREDPVWLQAQARAHLLEWKYIKAEEELDDALMQKPDAPGLLLDRATAFYQKGKQEGTIYYSDAINDLGKVLKQNPDDPIALFNRAILYQEWPIPDKAIDDLNHYLRVDPNSAWAEEARERLKQLEKLVKGHERASEPLASPQAFATLSGTPAGVDGLDQRIEGYQQIALQSWLPQAFSSNSKTEERQKALEASRALAALLRKRHGDRWFEELLDGTDGSPNSVAGINALGQAVSDSVKGNATEANAEAARAAAFFASTGNRAGMLRAQVERIYALRNAQQGDQCLAKAQELPQDLENKNYVWMQAQLYADLCSCNLMVKEFDRARIYASHALEKSKKGRFPVALLRSIGMAAFVETDEGQLLAAWKLNQEGLRVFWENDFSPGKRAQQFYDDLTYTAVDTNDLNMAVSLAQESVKLIALSGDRLVEAMARQHLAQLAVRDGQLSLAAQELQKLDMLSVSFAAKESLEAYRIYAQTGLAEIELREGKLHQAEDRLNAIRKDINRINTFTVARAFYLVYGELSEAQGKLSQAEWAFQNAAAATQPIRLKNSSERYSWAQENSVIYRSLIQLELKKGDTRKALVTWEWYRSALLGQVSTYRSLQSLWDFRKFDARMADLKDRTVISYSLLPDGLAVWVFDDHGLDMRWAPIDTGSLANLEEYFFAMCSDPQSDLARLQSRGHRLFDVLIRPVMDRLNPDRVVVIETDEVMADLPFPALVIDSDRYFGDSYRIVLSPGLLYADNHKHAGRLSRDSRILVVASTANFVDPELALNPAFDIVKEAEGVAELFPNARILKGHSATAPDMEAALPGVDVLHFVGHAISNAQREGLLLFKSSGDNEKETTIWSAERVNSALFRNAKLIVLSACSTGQNYRGRKEVHGKLVHALLQAGVPVVVGSRWDIESSPATQFMNRFYSALASNQSVSWSLHEAELATRNTAKTSHPYYWAAFSAFGQA